MIRGFLLALNIILLVLFIAFGIFNVKGKENVIGISSIEIALIIALNCIYILNS